ncbi:MAG TPA: hypothetical protein VIJ71_01075, partial [Mycobacteriales bacterium]
TSTVPGYAAGPGYDLATGLGTIDAARFVPALVAATATQHLPLSSAPRSAPSGSAAASTAPSHQAGAQPARAVHAASSRFPWAAVAAVALVIVAGGSGFALRRRRVR